MNTEHVVDNFGNSGKETEIVKFIQGYCVYELKCDFVLTHKKQPVSSHVDLT